MRIGSYDVKMAGSHSAEEVRTSEERLRYWGASENTEIERYGYTADMSNGSSDLLEISEEALELLKKNADDKNAGGNTANGMNAINTTNEVDNESTSPLLISERDKLKRKLIEEFIYRITGRRLKINIMSEIKMKEKDRVFFEKQKASLIPNAGAPVVRVQRQGWGLEYSNRSTHRETEKMTFKADGVVRTEDGKTIDFSVDLKISREVVNQTNISIKAGDALIDLLVINYSGKDLKLTDNKISFDIDLDGNKDNISFTSEGSGFLALDLNNDGVINDGRELFGPSTGNGFDELRQYDSDNNNWIDENDSIYDRLTIWTKDENGSDKLVLFLIRIFHLIVNKLYKIS